MKPDYKDGANKVDSPEARDRLGFICAQCKIEKKSGDRLVFSLASK